MHQPLFEHRQEFAGFQTRVLELEGDGPPFLLIHGFTDSADTWRLVLPHLARAGRAAVAIDLPGFGEASRLRGGGVLGPQSEFIAAVIRWMAKRHGDVIVSGNSLGGCLTLRAAADQSLPVAGAVPIAPAGVEFARLLNLMERQPAVLSLLAVPGPVPSWLIRQVAGGVFRRLAAHKGATLEPAVIDAYSAHYRDAATLRRYMKTGRLLVPELADAVAFEKIECPVLLVWGDKDLLLTHKGSDRVVREVPQTRYELIRNCGHCPQLEMPDRVADLLLGFESGLAVAA